MDFPGGELVPFGGGDNIPLLRPVLTIGRSDSCDICLRFGNVSGLHGELSCQEGLWFVKDLDSTNGIRVNGARIAAGIATVLYPNDQLTVANRQYTIAYESPAASRREGIGSETAEDIFSQPLLERAGLSAPQPQRPRRPSRP